MFLYVIKLKCQQYSVLGHISQKYDFEDYDQLRIIDLGLSQESVDTELFEVFLHLLKAKDMKNNHSALKY